MASPCLRYLMALASHLLRDAVLHKPTEESERVGTGTLPSSTQTTPRTNLAQIQTMVLSLASKIFTGAYEVSEILFVRNLPWGDFYCDRVYIFVAFVKYFDGKKIYRLITIKLNSVIWWFHMYCILEGIFHATFLDIKASEEMFVWLNFFRKTGLFYIHLTGSGSVVGNL